MSENVLPPRKLSIVRQALYDAKFALEQEVQGEERDRVIRDIMRALDLTVDPHVDIKPLTDEQLADLVARVRAAPTQGAAERYADQLAGMAVTPSMQRALAAQDAERRRADVAAERIALLEEELRAERQKVARLIMKKPAS
jgi:hypothetical protein